MIRNVTCAAIVVVSMLGCWSVAAGDLAEIRERGQLTMITFPHQESRFSRTNLDAGPTPELGTADHFVGADVELMSAFADWLGVELAVRRVSEPSYGALIPDLLAGRGDLIASSLTITPERAKKVSFSDPYFTAYKVVVTKADAAIENVDQLAGKRAAVIEGSSHHEQLLAMGVPPESISFVNFTLECFTAVADGTADYTVVDSIAAANGLAAEPRLRIAFRLPGDDHYGFAVPKDSPELLAALNVFLDEMRQSGKLDEIVSRHLARTIPEVS
jgi:ABC-type amino acid transport substrate-binding protein